MRIIDADRAKEIAEVSLGDIFLQTALKLLIDKVPTLDAVEVVHGHFIKVTELCGIDVLKCSVCGVSHPRKPSAYCPDCGAKMDGEK